MSAPRPSADPAERLRRALISLDGLSVGDAFGERFFGSPLETVARIERRRAPPPPWLYTDDTEMALAVVESLRARGAIEQDFLAARFAARYARNPHRGYGRGAHEILRAIGAGVPWRRAARAAFGGEGSRGNGGAMRAAPIGAYFADDPERAAAEARASAEVTHAHPDGQAGAIAVAVAAAAAAAAGAVGSLEMNERSSISREVSERSCAPREVNERPCVLRQVNERSCVLPAVLDAALALTPPGPTRDGLARAHDVPLDAPPPRAARTLGNGSRVLASDTVPYAVWCAARHARDFEAACWTAVEALGDIDTIAAIVGGIVALSTAAPLPPAWLAAREALA